ncbi:MAG: SIR2 family protein, partial [Pseudomonadota bacterium]
MKHGCLFDRKKHYPSLVSLAKAHRRGRLIIVLGPGLAVHAGSPTLMELVKSLKIELDLYQSARGPMADTLDPFFVTQMYQYKYGRDALVSRIRQAMDPTSSPTDVHKSIAGLAPSHIFTVGYDGLMEKALFEAGKPYRVISRDSEAIDEPPEYGTTVAKLYGDSASPEGIVVTRKDIFEYHSERGGMVERFMKCLREYEALFVGISLRGDYLEWLLQRTLPETGAGGTGRFILVEGRDDHLADYYGIYSLSPVLLGSWQEVQAFLEELAAMAA